MEAIHRIRTEQPYKKMWDMFYLFENEETTRTFLELRYQTIGRQNPQRDAYLATPKLIFNTKQAREYYRSAEFCDTITKPLLLYYGMVSLIKALIVTRNPEYPTSTSVLKHGLSTRKLKREDYRFIEDDARIQKDGLFPTFFQMFFGVTLTSQQKFPIKYMLAAIPDLRHMFERLYGPSCVANLTISNHKNFDPSHFFKKAIQDHQDCIKPTIYSHLWVCDRSILQGAQKTKQEALDLLQTFCCEDEVYTDLETPEPEGLLQILRVAKIESTVDHPLLFYDLMGEKFLYLPKNVHLQIPEICIHFLIMYVLGMLCRYETERWGEIIFHYSSQDLIIIHEFLSISMRKFPNLILNKLLQETYYFYSV
ncbi:YaaC family protein [Fodinisporobacter ferrooxydans]|uniref:YaaC family protein n=1 Tax=Fodinisporobacter ferrooxydans TaxID=2901836 RepID=A0ABY4CMQ4_9BACL|nr:YaaC family protein [Alicyclobacillaceae bacterium MYW30-H2]